MKRICALLAVSVSLAGCGSSAQSTQARRQAQCRADGLAWARSYAASLPGRLTAAQFQALAASAEQCVPEP